MSETIRILREARTLVASGWCNGVAKDVSGNEVEPGDVSARRFGLLGALLRVTGELRLKNRPRSFESALRRLGSVVSTEDVNVDVIDLIDRNDSDKRRALRLLDRAIQG